MQGRQPVWRGSASSWPPVSPQSPGAWSHLVLNATSSLLHSGRALLASALILTRARALGHGKRWLCLDSTRLGSGCGRQSCWAGASDIFMGHTLPPRPKASRSAPESSPANIHRADGEEWRPALGGWAWVTRSLRPCQPAIPPGGPGSVLGASAGKGTPALTSSASPFHLELGVGIC